MRKTFFILIGLFLAFSGSPAQADDGDVDAIPMVSNFQTVVEYGATGGGCTQTTSGCPAGASSCFKCGGVGSAYTQAIQCAQICGASQ